MASRIITRSRTQAGIALRKDGAVRPYGVRLAGGMYKPAWAWLNVAPHRVPMDVVSQQFYPVTGGLGSTIIPGPEYWAFVGNNTTNRINIGSVDSSHPLSLQSHRGFTVIADVYLSSTFNNDYPRIIDKTSSGGYADGWALNYDAGSSRYCFGMYSATAYASVYATSNNRHRLIATGAGPAEGIVKTLYLHENGAWKTPDTNTRVIPSSTTNAAIGNWNHATDREWAGRIYSIIVYDWQLPIKIAKEIALNPDRILRPVNDTFFSVPAGGGVTGTGDLVGAGSEIVGTGTRAVTGAGALEGQGAAVVGTGERTITGTGVLIGQGSDVAGTGATGGVHTGTGDLIGAGSEIVGVGERTVKGTGALVAQGSAVVGVGERTVVGSGDLVGAGAEVSGSGAVGGITTGTGDLVGAGSEVVGTGIRTVTGSGALVAQGSAVTGTGERTIVGAGALVGSGSEIVGAGVGGDVKTGAGALVGQGSAVTGTGTRKITGVGELVAAGSIIVGAGVRTITGSGALVGAGTEVSGSSAYTHDFIDHNGNTWTLGPRGRVWQLENRNPYDAHKRGREVCSS